MTEILIKRLLLVPYTDERVTGEHVAWLKDPEVVRYSEQRHVGHTLNTQKLYVGWTNLNGKLWLIRHNGEDIGSISVRIDKNNKVGNMGILIGRKDIWGRGYATEAWQAVMKYCFTELELRKVECGTMNANIGMRKTAVKSGMAAEGIRLGHFLLDGETQDMLLYGKLAK